MFLLLVAIPHARAASFLEHWRAVGDDFRENYSYTTYKGVDWSEVFETNRARFEGELTAEQFAINLNESLRVLHDWHVAVQKPDGLWIGYSAPYPRNYPAQIATNHAALPYENYQGAGALGHARLTNGAVHLIIPTLETAMFDKIEDDDLFDLFQSFEHASGLIVDLRYNAGGNELHARRLAAFFVQVPTLYGYTRTRAPAEPGGFTPLTDSHVLPNPIPHLDLPLVVLIGQRCLSSCEWLTLMFREAPNAILMGDRTRGGTANPVLKSIPELGVNYLRSRWIGYTPEMEIVEDRGILPAVSMRPEWSYDDATGRDFLLEHAIAYLDWRQRIGNPRTPINRRTDTDRDGASDASEFVAGTNPFDSGSLLRLGIAGPVPTLEWTTTSRRAFVIFESSSPSGAWNQHPSSPLYFPLTTLKLSGSPAQRFFHLSAELAP
jgi:hypothetical protein